MYDVNEIIHNKILNGFELQDDNKLFIEISKLLETTSNKKYCHLINKKEDDEKIDDEPLIEDKTIFKKLDFGINLDVDDEEEDIFTLHFDD
jgi:hypothetical protein